MRIAILSFYSGINQRGVERWVYDLASRLWVTHEVTVFQNNPLGIRTNYSIRTSGINFNEGKTLSGWIARHLFIDYKSLKVLHFTLAILKTLFKENFDIVIPTDGGWEPAIVRIITWLRRKKMVVIGHAGIGWDDTNNLLCFPDTFVALSSYAKVWAEKTNPFVKTVYIPDGVDMKLFRPDGDKIDFGLKRPLLLCVSSLEKGKRVDLVIKAVSLLKNYNLLVCGRGTLERKIYKFGQKLLGKRFKLKSYDFDKMPLVYRSADVLLSASLPSYSFEMVLVEAMASGLSVIANNDPIRSEIVGKAGFLIDVRDTRRFSEVIGKVLQKQNAQGYSLHQAGRYSWDKILSEYVSLFERLQQS
ncbi:MAG: glycosyl transferase family 1 [Candidatus Woesebacteria bacterium GW2011_GWA1_39_21]|uniref:Glycosyl transferase family 1 n=1 Tax=Candidatus Woesebacteria bacterium GW2011_GWA1_39_21 TaxID=1618550 RepID=A0A0G0N6C9_9BACT|nr:MAG: glycosyl transferase family 1 [Candidatus Woesebacteria bacterium GW2011_GWA1_39_21]